MELTTYLQYKETERFLESFITAKPLPHFVAAPHAPQRQNPFGLERVRSFLAESGNPHLQQNYIHIAGTSGKTSAAYFTAAVFQAQGYQTGLFTSPHLTTFAEYFTINQRLPPVQELIDLVAQAKPLIDREYETKNWGMISYAELLLALALQYFALKNVDYVALEAFLGGSTDATNVIARSAVSIITNIGLDHTHILGDTLAEIAAAKAGIVKAGCPLITAEARPEILALFSQAASQAATTVQVLGKDFRIEQIKAGKNDTSFDYISAEHTYKELTTSMCGAYQASNAALAIRALEIASRQNGKTIDETAVRKGLLATFIPGRFEIVCHDPVVILDGAHNPDKIAHFVAYLKSRFQPEDVIFVCGFTTGKNPAAMLAAMLAVSSHFYLTRVLLGYREDEEPRYLKSVLAAFCPTVNAVIKSDPLAALAMAMEEAKCQRKVVCVTGSLYLVAHLRQRWHPEYQILTNATVGRNGNFDETSA